MLNAGKCTNPAACAPGVTVEHNHGMQKPVATGKRNGTWVMLEWVGVSSSQHGLVQLHIQISNQLQNRQIWISV